MAWRLVKLPKTCHDLQESHQPRVCPPHAPAEEGGAQHPAAGGGPFSFFMACSYLPISFEITLLYVLSPALSPTSQQMHPGSLPYMKAFLGAIGMIVYCHRI